MGNSSEYKVFDTAVFRTPIYSLNKYWEKSDLFCTSEIINNKVFVEAIFLASPALFVEINKYLRGDLKEEKLLKFKISILKYYIRMSIRCTPFGLFAGVGVLKIDKVSQLILSELDRFMSHTRLDMRYTCSLISNIEKLENIRKKIKYYINNSLYDSDKYLRYTEYRIINNRRKYSLTAIEKDSYLESIVHISKNGISIAELCDFLTKDGIDIEEANEYIDELIENQVLISEFSPSVTGEDLLDQTIEKLNHIKDSSNLLGILHEIRNSLLKIDSISIGRDIKIYERVKSKISELKIDFEEKYLFQSDLVMHTQKNLISNVLVDQVWEGIKVLNKLAQSSENQNLIKFREEFKKRYEDEEIPLTEALDVETGIGFADFDSTKGGISPLLEGIPFFTSSYKNTISLDPVDSIILDKYNNFLRKGKMEEMEICDEDFINLHENWEDLPDTFSALIEILEIWDDPKKNLIVLNKAGNTSATNVLGRFCYCENEIYSLVKEITQIEQKLNEEKILAEIVHLPESRTGNVVMRPVLREYEIPYLARDNVKKENVIPITDLMVSIQGERIILRSKKLSKEVLPRLASAHTFWVNSLPIYHFLGALQTQGLRPGLFFRWGAFLNNKSYLPRVRYKNIILSPAIWNISSKDIKNIPKITDVSFYQKVKEFKEKMKLPNLVQLVIKDNCLLIDFDHLLSVQMLFSEVKKNGFKLQEFLYNDKCEFAKRGKEIFTNEIILNFYKIKG